MTEVAEIEAPENEADSPADIDLDKFKEGVKAVAEDDAKKAKDRANAGKKATETPQKATEGAEDAGEATEADPDAKPPKETEADEWKPTAAQTRMAKQLGYTSEEIAELTEEDIEPLERAARKHSQRMSEIGRTQAEAKKAAEAAAAAGDKGASRPGTEDDFVEADLLTVDDEGAYPALGKLNTMKAEIADIAEQLGEMREKEQKREDAETDNVVEKFWSELDAKVHTEFGEGPTTGLIEGSPERELRAKLIEKAGEIRAGHASTNDGEMDLGESLEQALLIIGSEAIKRAAKQAGEKEAARKRRTKQRSAGPTQRPTTQTGYRTPEEAAVAEIKEHQSRGKS